MVDKTKIAIPIYGGRVSNVFDFAHRLLIIEFENEKESARSEVDLSAVAPMQRAGRLQQLKVNVLVCGAISRPLAGMIAAEGIEVIPYITGGTEEVIQAYIDGVLRTTPRYRVPGCGAGPGRGRRWRHGIK